MCGRRNPRTERSVQSTVVTIGLLAIVSLAMLGSQPAVSMGSTRFATFNVSLYRSQQGELIQDLRGNDLQARVIAEIVQRVRPEVLLINEFDYDADGTAAELFQSRYLSVGENGAEPIEYPYVFLGPSNTGVYTSAGQMIGYGLFEGQYGMLLLSMYPIDYENARTFRNFLWKDMPSALLPKNPDTGASWYSSQRLRVLPLSSKSHWDVPILVEDQTIHVLASHPTPPSFDGAEDANGCRNHDEIRFWADYISGSAYIYDDDGRNGGLEAGDHFVIMGDENADPIDGDSTGEAILQLLDSPLVNTSVTPSSEGGAEQAALQGGINGSHRGDPHYDTADFGDAGTCGNLRADYVLPSATLEILDTGVFWPLSSDPLFRLVGVNPFPSSDHRLVWADLRLPAE